jgi:hypothetical protein
MAREAASSGHSIKIDDRDNSQLTCAVFELEPVAMQVFVVNTIAD